MASPAKQTPHGLPWGRITFFLAILLAHLPLAIHYLRWVWAFEHYHFLPFAVIGAVWLFTTRFRTTAFTRLPKVQRIVVLVLLGLSIITLIVGTSIQSPLVGWLALVLAVGSGLFAHTDRFTNRSLWHLWLPVILTLRLPLGRDTQLIAWLQSTTSSYASSLLDAFGVLHHMAGNVVELSDKQFFVEEACSGVQSVFTLLFLSAFYSALERRSLARSLLLMFSAFFWAGFMNVFRVATISLSYAWFEVDLSAGWQHEALGYVALVAAFVMLVSTDRLLYFLLSPITDQVASGSFVNRFVRGWNRVMGWGDFELLDKPKSSRSNRRGPVQISIVAVVTAVAFLAVGATQVVLASRAKTRSAPILEHLVADGDVDLSGDNWIVDEFLHSDRTANSAWGRFSDSWNLVSPIGQCVIDLAYPFREWHDLTVCYRGNGWDVVRTQTYSGPDAGDWPCVAFDLVNPSGEHACVVYSQFDTTGRGLVPATEDLLAAITDRMRETLSGSTGGEQIIQAQIVIQLEQPVTDSLREQLIAKHLTSRQQLRTVVMTQTAGGTP